jgi:hypothetical protein
VTQAYTLKSLEKQISMSLPRQKHVKVCKGGKEKAGSRAAKKSAKDGRLRLTIRMFLFSLIIKVF